VDNHRTHEWGPDAFPDNNLEYEGFADNKVEYHNGNITKTTTIPFGFGVLDSLRLIVQTFGWKWTSGKWRPQ
jgi:hypothetical protein